MPKATTTARALARLGQLGYTATPDPLQPGRVLVFDGAVTYRGPVRELGTARAYALEPADVARLEPCPRRMDAAGAYVLVPLQAARAAEGFLSGFEDDTDGAEGERNAEHVAGPLAALRAALDGQPASDPAAQLLRDVLAIIDSTEPDHPSGQASGADVVAALCQLRPRIAATLGA